MKGRHVLVVAWWFPPLAGGGVHRPLQFVRHLVRRGARVTVLTAVPPAGERLDEGLLAKVPGGVEVRRVALLDPFRAWAWLKGRLGRGAVAPRPVAASVPAPPATPIAAPTSGRRSASWRDAVTELIALPDRWLPWIPSAVLDAALALRSDAPDLVFSTSPPHSMHLVGRALAGLFNCAHVLDFRDPWSGNPFRTFRTPWLQTIDDALERLVVTSAAQVVLNTPALERQFRRRYPDFARVRTIPNGFDPDAFAHLPPPTGGAVPGRLEIAHFGQLYGLRSGRWLLHGLARLRSLAPDLFARLLVTFIGSIDGEAAFRELAASLGVADRLSIPGALPHGAALARQRRSDLLLLLGPENREPEIQVPGKLYEYLAAERPILTLSREGGAIAEMLAQAAVPHVRAEPDDPDAIASALLRAAAAAGDAEVGAASREGTARFRYDRLGDRLVECFEDAWRGAGAAAPALDAGA